MANFRRVLIKAHQVLNLQTSTSKTPISAFIGLQNRLTNQSLNQHGFLRCSSTNTNPLYADIDLSNDESKRRLFNRLLYRSKQRGFLELDLVLGKWVEDHISSLDADGIKALIYVLDLENPDLWKWLTGQEQPPEMVKANPVRHSKQIMTNFVSRGGAVVEDLGFEGALPSKFQVFSRVQERVMNNLNRHASPETRSTPGQQWVRGWDDFKKGRDGPITGNQ